MSGFTKKAVKKAREKIEEAKTSISESAAEAGKSGKYQIFAIPYLNSVRDDDKKVGLAKLLRDPNSEFDITMGGLPDDSILDPNEEFTVPPGLVDFTALFDHGFKKNLDGACNKIAQYIKFIKDLCKADEDDGGPVDPFTQPDPGMIVALAVPSFDVTVTTAKSVWKEISGNPKYFESQVEEFRRIAVAYIDKSFNNVLAEAQDAMKVLGTCLVTVKNCGSAKVEPAVQTIADANTALAAVNNAIGQQVELCKTNIAMACANSLSGFIKLEIKQEKAILTNRGKKVASVGADAGLIAAHAAHGVGTMGATAGLAIVGIVRAGVDMGQEVKNCIMTLDMLAKEINGYIVAVQKIYVSGKARQMVQEGAIAIIQGVTCLDLPTVSTCYGKIEEYKYKIALLESSCAGVRRQQQAVRDALDDYKKMYKDQLKNGDVSVQNRKDWGVFYAAVTETYIDLMEIGDDKDDRIAYARQNVAHWTVTLAKFDPAVSKVGEVTDMAATLIVSGGTSIGGIGAEALDTTLTGLELAYGLIVEESAGIVEIVKDVFKK